MFVGPNKHFSIVIDEFDGKIVKAWHIENSKGEKSPATAPAASTSTRGRQGLPPTAHFISRFYPPCMTKP
ncbi:MAG: transcription factor [Bilophila wadsworthia]